MCVIINGQVITSKEWEDGDSRQSTNNVEL